VTQQIINVGSAINDGTGDPARTAFTKSNDNFTELYARGGGGTSAPQGRLTLQTATPVMTATQSAKTTIYYTPHVGNQIVLYSGTAMVPTTFVELSVATTDTTRSPAAIGASKVNDWFVWSDAGTLRLGHGPDWTSDTVRSAGTALVMVNGIWLNNAAITNGPAASRGTYVGTTRSNASSQLDWQFPVNGNPATPALFNVWNVYNRVQVRSVHGSTLSTQTFASPARPYFNDTGLRVTFVSGLAEDAFQAIVLAQAICNPNGAASVSIGYNSTTTYSGLTTQVYCAGTSILTPISGMYNTVALGGNFFQMLQTSDAIGAVFYGQTAVAQTGIIFEGRM
jgi:hypothetical protein